MNTNKKNLCEKLRRITLLDNTVSKVVFYNSDVKKLLACKC